MTDQPLDLDAIEARANNATPGPWEPRPHQHMSNGCRCTSCYDDPTGWSVDHDNTTFCDDAVARLSAAGKTNDFGREFDSCGEGPFLTYADAEFIAHARTDVPALVAEIRRLRAENDALRLGNQAMDTSITELRDCLQAHQQAEPSVCAEIRRRRLTAELQQAQQQTADRIAAELATVDPPEWAFAGQYGGQDAIRIARAVGAGCNCENADEPGHYVDHLTTAPRATPCRAPHPVAEHSCCQLPAGHDGWHAASVGSWPSSNWPPTTPAAVSGA